LTVITMVLSLVLFGYLDQFGNIVE
jgi:hypothetical protein